MEENVFRVATVKASTLNFPQLHNVELSNRTVNIHFLSLKWMKMCSELPLLNLQH